MHLLRSITCGLVVSLVALAGGFVVFESNNVLRDISVVRGWDKLKSTKLISKRQIMKMDSNVKIDRIT